MDETTNEGAAAATPVADKNTGIVAIDSGEHAEAKGIYASIKGKLGEIGAEMEAELKKLEALLHL